MARIGADGTITAYSAGSTTITVHVSKDAVKLSQSAELTVHGAAGLASVRLEGPATVQRGGTAQLRVAGKLENGFAADLSGAEIRYFLTQESRAASVDEASGLVTGLEEGSVTIQASVTYGGTLFETEPKTLLVRSGVTPPEDPVQEPGDVIIDFTINQNGSPLDATFYTHGWEIDREGTAEALVSGARILRYQSIGLDIRPGAVDVKKRADLALRVKIPNEGAYQLDIDYATASSGILTAVFVDGVYMGQYDCYSAASGVGKGSISLNSIALSAGEHVVTLRQLNSKAQMFISALKFRLLESLPQVDKIVAEADKNILSVGESAHITAGVRMTDGSYLNMGKSFEGGNDKDNSILITNTDAAVLRLEDKKIRALKPGSGRIELDVTLDGSDYSETIDITVTDQKLASVSASLDGSLVCRR